MTKADPDLLGGGKPFDGCRRRLSRLGDNRVPSYEWVAHAEIGAFRRDAMTILTHHAAMAPYGRMLLAGEEGVSVWSSSCLLQLVRLFRLF